MIDVNQNLCTGCGACYNICPKKCITMQENSEGFCYPVVDKEQCTGCDLCIERCPIDKKQGYNARMYSVVNKSTIPEGSSSTGLVNAIARQIIADGGKVYGAAFDEDYVLIHKEIRSFDNLRDLQGSKYVQSNAINVYKEVYETLLQNKKALFIGTPCQVAGIRTFLKNDYNNLYTIDIICHGVPSPKVWKYYLQHIKKKSKLGEIKSIDFRDRRQGWANYGLRISGENREYFALRTEDLYEKAFSRNITLRKSCYFCRFKGNNRYSDLTLGDFWGGNKYTSVFNNRGTSIVSVNNERGAKLLDNVLEKFDYEEIDSTKYFRYHNKAMYSSAKLSRARKCFFDKFSNSPDKIAEHLAKGIQMTETSFKLNGLKGKLDRGWIKILDMFNHTK